MEGPARYAFEILPKEVWEMIILEVKDSEGIRNLMKASKQLNDAFMKIHHLWLLDKILPILTTPKFKKKFYLRALEDEDVMNLRLVDKRWCGAVNTFLENQPSLRPYNKDDDKLNSEMHIWSHRNYRHEGWGYDWTTIGKVTLRNDEHQLSEYGQTVEAVSDFGNSGRNPFPARSIVRYPEQDWGLEDLDDLKLWGVLDQDVAQKLSKQVWFLDLEWAEDTEKLWRECKPSSVWKWIVNSLACLPSLKGLHLQITYTNRFYVEDENMTDSEVKAFLQSDDNQLPPLPFFESLTISTFNEEELLIPNLFSQQLMSKYSLQLRRLQISTLAWETREKWMLPNLTELILEDIDTSVKVTQILKSLEAPQLTKLMLTTQHFGSRTTLKMEEDIFPWIALFPSLLHLDVSYKEFIISESGKLSLQQDSKHSLKYLKIHNSHDVNYSFLRCLPSLQRLQIRVDEKPIIWDCSTYPEVRIKLEIETNSLYQSNVWDLCPKLRSISIYSDYWSNDTNYEEFDRATYEKLKNSPELLDSVKLRREILDFLRPDSDTDSDGFEVGNDDEEEEEDDTDSDAGFELGNDDGEEEDDGEEIEDEDILELPEEEFDDDEEEESEELPESSQESDENESN